MKESFSKVVASLWLKPIDTDNVAASYFDSAKFEPENITLKRFMARKFGTLGEWEPFETWFVAL